MTFNNYQKLISFLYCCLLLFIFLKLTPYHHYQQYELNGIYRDSENVDTIKDYYGNFFYINTPQIIFKKLYFEIGLLTVIYSLSLIILKRNKNANI